MADTEKDYMNDYAVCRVFAKPQEFKNHQQNPPTYAEGDDRNFNILQSDGVIRLEAPDIQIFPATSVKWDKNTDTYTKKVIYDGQEYTFTYKLIVKNKGTDNEEVTALILPDSSQINFEGWDI